MQRQPVPMRWRFNSSGNLDLRFHHVLRVRKYRFQSIWFRLQTVPTLETKLYSVSTQHVHSRVSINQTLNKLNPQYSAVAVRKVGFSSSYSTTKIRWFQFQPLAAQCLLIHSKFCPFSQRLVVLFHLWRKRKYIPCWGKESR